MAEQTWWWIVAGAAVATGVIGFIVGRITKSANSRVAELEAELVRQKSQVDDFRQKVDAHFDQTASLFVSMASSYKGLFDHLAQGYETLSSDASKGLFKDRVAALLTEGGVAVAAAVSASATEVEAAAAQADPAADAAQPEIAETADTAGAVTTGADAATAETAVGADTCAEPSATTEAADSSQVEAEQGTRSTV